jgi:ATP-dependent helicase/nuclease subunit A
VNPERVVAADDESARRLAQREFVRPIVVEAGAGTGKTALLVARVAAWCVGEGWESNRVENEAPEAVARRVIERVVAITFTEAAAAEMAGRIAEALVGLSRGDPPVGWEPGDAVTELDGERLALRATALAGAVHRLQVTTIHAYCQGVLAAHPFEAGLHPHFEIDAEGRAIEALVDEVVEEALRTLDEAPDAGHWEVVAAAGVGPTQVAEALRLLVAAGARPSDLQRDPFSDSAVAELRAQITRGFSDFFAREDGRLAAVPRNRAAGEAREALALAAREVEGLGDRTSAPQLRAVLDALAGAPLTRLRKWAKSDLTQGERGQLADAADGVVAAAAELLAGVEPVLAVDIEAFAAARSLLAELLREVESRRKVRGLVTFNDLLERAAWLLEEREEVCSAERRRIDQLLVDEFQDTDSVQCRIVARLGLDGPDSERPGLFIVGDPKQSIYAWRSADLEAYDRFVRRVVDGGGVRAPLTRNFRSVAPILEEVERIVEPVMHRQEGLQPAFEALDATGPRRRSAGFEHSPWSAVEHWLCWPADEDGIPHRPTRRQQPINELEAEAIADDILRLHEEADVRFGDTAVLLRATTAMGPLLEAFRARGVPFEVAREREYFRQREIVDAAALIRAVLEPADVLALLTVIRSDVVGVPDAALAPLWDAGLPAAAAALNGFDGQPLSRVRGLVESASSSVGSVPGAALLTDWSDSLIGALETLAELRSSAVNDPPDIFVERVRTLWLAEVAAGTRTLGRFRQARLDGFFADLERAMGSGDGTSAELARFLRRAVEEGREAPTASEPDREANAVHVMTIYGAKGLDFEHVYVAQIHKRTGAGSSREAAVLRRFDGRTELSLFGWPTPGFGRAERHRELQARAERVRLLYVAMTRAKQRVVVSGGWAEPGLAVDPLAAASLAELVAHRADAELIDDLIARGVEREASLEPAVSWVLPALDEGLKRRVVRLETASAPNFSAAADDAERIGRDRAAAIARMSRRWTITASDAEGRSTPRLEEEIESEAVGCRVSVDGNAAAAVGTAIHRLLETIDLEAALPPQLDAHRTRLIDDAGAELDDGEARRAAERIEALLDAIRDGDCLNRLAELATSVVARELPVILRPGEDDGGSSVVSGTIDLVYTDADDGRLVVADYKTDAVDDEAKIAERVERYRPQLETYARALEQALALEERPRAELWFLHADRIVRL